MAGALGDPTRRAIFERLAERPCVVGELADAFPVSRPAVSQHLKILKDAGLVLDQPIGRNRLYRVDPAGVDAMRTYFDRFWTKALANFAARVELVRATQDPTIETPQHHETDTMRETREIRNDEIRQGDSD